VAEENGEKKLTGWQMVGLFALRIVDSGLAPWALVGLFLLGGMYVLTRNLDSKDSLAFLARFGTLHGFAWAGWIVAFIEIPICKWAINRARNLRLNQLNQLQDQSDKSVEELKKMKQSQLELKPDKTGPK
jgi:hypothetical protein